MVVNEWLVVVFFVWFGGVCAGDWFQRSYADLTPWNGPLWGGGWSIWKVFFCKKLLPGKFLLFLLLMPSTSNCMNVSLCFCLSLVYQSLAEPVFFHWFNPVFFLMIRIFPSRMFLLNLRNSFFVGLRSLVWTLFLWFGLCSFTVMNVCVFLVSKTLSSIPSLVGIFISLYVLV